MISTIINVSIFLGLIFYLLYEVNNYDWKYEIVDISETRLIIKRGLFLSKTSIFYRESLDNSPWIDENSNRPNKNLLSNALKKYNFSKNARKDV